MEKVKSVLKKLLTITGLYESWEYSKVHLEYAKFNNPLFFKHQKQFFDISQSRLPSQSLIFDIGANVGNKTDVYLSLGCSVIAVEPDKRCVKILKRRFSKNRNFTLVDKAIGSKAGIEKFYVTSPGSAFNTLSVKHKQELEAIQNTLYKGSYTVNVVTIDDLIYEFGSPDYIKIDVEGCEIEAISGLSKAIPLISFEANLPSFIRETIQSVSYIYGLDNRYVFNYVTSDLSQFVLDEYKDYRYFLNFLQTTDIPYMEIFCKRKAD
ncbi:FkbM family methyltransferase [Anabaenopsis sp. FSS-46]|uniref:FkbM family methyltransferase n=1 Tax=Anabaenopsis sp. FSS-46 TaxID=2971766 RepID=UPI0024758715|nr:FkbM family methyltransferase [Anabaenopsis sp. FSS-46]MDH6100727.1 FkbM family methyltransferase [Anabaenopsis sp. FSS-46]